MSDRFNLYFLFPALGLYTFILVILPLYEGFLVMLLMLLTFWSFSFSKMNIKYLEDQE